jgi:hypothetical protein
MRGRRPKPAFAVSALMMIATSALAGDVGPYDLPNPALTPGDINAAVTQESIKQTVCVSGYTKTIRPPATVTTALKKKQLDSYKFSDGSGFADKSLKSYEEDHLISLEIGGNPTSEKNLWPEIYLSKWGAHIKDRLENELKSEVCSGKITLDEAQTCIRSNWITCYQAHVGALK